jgi:dTMP kinase
VFVTLEGIDGAGKSTQADLLAQALGPRTRLLREPGGTEAGERLRELLKDPELELSARAELLMFCAARAELVERVIRPALEAGEHVVCDRFMDSTVAYQGAGRGLGTELVAAVVEAALAGCVPDRTILLEVELGVAEGRGANRALFGVDRFEREAGDFQRRIVDEFARIAEREPERVSVVDAAGSVEVVHREICRIVGVDPLR